MAVFAFSQALAEITPYFIGGILPEQRFAVISSGEFEPAGSRWSRNLFLTDCLEVPRTPFILRQPAARRAPFLENCREGAYDIVASSPTSSNAWLVIATTSASLQDYDAMTEALAKSKLAAPGIEMLANRRSRLAELNFDKLGPAGIADYQSDLEVLARESEGIDVLAQRFVRQPDHRDAYERAVETANARQKMRFINAVRYATRDK